MTGKGIKGYQAVIFDWDGTLMDSCGTIVRCFQQACAAAGEKVPDGRKIRNLIGADLHGHSAELLPDAENAGVEEVMKHYRRLLERSANSDRFFPGVLDGLARLKHRGYRLAVATGKSRFEMTQLINRWQLRETVEISVCSQETASKPDPAMLLAILKIMDLDIRQAVMVGDSAFDMEMARTIGMDRMGVTYGAHPYEKLKGYDPVRVFSSFEQCVKWFGSQ